jgi:hypothetical protein
MNGAVNEVNDRKVPEPDGPGRTVGIGAMGSGGVKSALVSRGGELARTGSRPSRPSCSPVVEPALYHVLRPLLVGIVHGLAGSAAVALLMLATIRNSAWAFIYLLVFGVGTIAGMMLITAAIAMPYAYTGQRFGRLNRYLASASGLLTSHSASSSRSTQRLSAGSSQGILTGRLIDDRQAGFSIVFFRFGRASTTIA